MSTKLGLKRKNHQSHQVTAMGQDRSFDLKTKSRPLYHGVTQTQYCCILIVKQIENYKWVLI